MSERVIKLCHPRHGKTDTTLIVSPTFYHLAHTEPKLRGVYDATEANCAICWPWWKRFDMRRLARRLAAALARRRT